MAKNDTELRAVLLPVDLAMRWSVGVSFGMVLVKGTGYLLTNSAAVLGDAAESIVHVVGVLFAAYSLRLSHKPADETHRYGHAKISFFSAGVEGTMIVIAALFIYVESIRKLIQPEPLTHPPPAALLGLEDDAVDGRVQVPYGPLEEIGQGVLADHVSPL